MYRTRMMMDNARK